MLCYRAFAAGRSITDRKYFTKSSDCKAILDISFWGVIDVATMKINSIVNEIVFPNEKVHNHSLDEFSIPASDTYPKLRSFIENCVTRGMGHQNTFIQVMKLTQEEMVSAIGMEIGKNISRGETRFFPQNVRSISTGSVLPEGQS